MRIFQLTAEDVERSSTLEPADIGKWCYLNNGGIEGFFATKEEAETRLAGVEIVSDPLWEDA